METLAALVPKIREMGGREAIRWIHGFQARTITYGDLWGRIGACVRYLREKGAIKGDRILIWSEETTHAVREAIEVARFDHRSAQ